MKRLNPPYGKMLKRHSDWDNTMGFLDWFKKKPEAKTQTKEIDLADISKEIDELKSVKLAPIFKEIKKIIEDSKSAMLEVKESAIKLKKMKVKEEVDKRLLVRIESARSNLVNRTSAECENLPILKEDSVNSINEFHEAFKQKLDSLNIIGRKYGEAVSVLFSKELEILSNKIKKVNNVFFKYIETVGNNKTLLEEFMDIDEIKKCIDEDINVYELLSQELASNKNKKESIDKDCLLYTSPSPRDRTRSRMPSSA